MVMAQSLFMTLAREHPGVRIDVLAPAWSQPLLARMPEVNQAISVPIAHGELRLAARYRLGRQLRGRKYARAIVIPRSFKAALIPFFARVPQRTGYRGESRYGLINDMRPLDRQVLSQTVQRYVALSLERGVSLPPPVPYPHLTVDESNRAAVCERLGLQTGRPVVAMMPGAEYGPAKCWPAARFAEVARRLSEEGRQIWLLGSERDRPVAEEIVTGSGGQVFNLCGKTRLEDVVDLLSLVQLALTNDSGLMHVAAATGRHVIAIYGSSTPRYTPPLSDKAHVVYLDVECSPCFKRICPYGHTRCLNEISAAQVLDRIAEVSNAHL
ncbi:MAG: lipopolysaccharide heptosyltransferase II [Pseudomonadota bacterium]|nr:MAG: lipopolysaccharide heptosyltransferase II [Pseudomonadota bacterium]